MRGKWVLVLLFANTVYLLLGGLAFSLLENGSSPESSNDTALAYGEFLDNNSCVSEAELHELARTLIASYDAGKPVLPNDTSAESVWTFDTAVFFCVTVVTTIGFGTIAPTTVGGRIFLMIYALIGIPMLMTFLAQLGIRVGRLNKKLADRMRFFHNPKLDTIFDTLVIFIVGYTVFIIVPGGIFTVTEGWTYPESAYYAFVTLSTIGFGDFVAGTTDDGSTNSHLYRIFLSLWMLMGLSWFAGVISTIQNLDSRVVAAVETPPNKDSPEVNSRHSSGEGSIKKHSEKPDKPQESAIPEDWSVRF